MVLFAAAFLRLYKLGSIPPHLTPDEAALGYNAFSIMKTGRDEYGKFMPFVFKSFGDYKPGLYVYVTIPFVFSMGLNEFSVRVPSAILGVISVLLIYLVVREIYGRKSSLLPLLSSIFLAISPWHMYFSRGAWEINLSLTLTLAAIYFFLKARVRQYNLILSAFFFGLTLIAYQGAKLSSLIVVLLLVIFFVSDLKKISLKNLGISLLAGLIVSSPIVYSMFTGQAGRLSVFSIFSSPRPTSYLQNFLDQGNEKINSISYFLFHSEWLNFLRGIMGRWFNHFSGRFLFFEGDWSNPRHSAPFSGELLFMDLPLLIVGGLTLMKSKLNKESGFVVAWLFLACLPSVLSRDQVHAVRSFNMVIPLAITIALGMEKLINLSKHKIFIFAFTLTYIFSFAYYLNMYFIHLPKLNSQYWGYGYKQLVESITPIQSSYKKIIFQQSYNQPYIYFLFFNKYDPSKYQKLSNFNFVPSPYGDVGQVTQLENIYFQGIDWQVLRGMSGTLVVGDAERIPKADSQEGTEFHVVSDIKYLDGKTDAYRIVEIK